VPKQEPTQKILNDLRNDLTAVTILVEHLYCTHFSQIPDGRQQLDRASESIRERCLAATIPGCDRPTSDDIVLSISKYVSASFIRIQERLSK
jgi:hypothetical protein